MKKFKVIVSIFLIVCMVMLIIFPDKYIKLTFDGVKIWALNVLPSLLPFFFLTTLFTFVGFVEKMSYCASPLTKRLYGVSGIGFYTQLMSFLSGYPVGAKTVSDLAKNNVISRKQANSLATFSSTSGPLFIVGSVGIGMFLSKKIGYILLLSHLLGSVLCGMIFKFILKPDCESSPAVSAKTCDNVLYESIYSAVISVMIVGGFIAIFYTLSQIVSDIKILYPLEVILKPVFGDLTDGILTGIIECTMGAKKLSMYPSDISVTLTCGIISFGGISVWCQSLIYLTQAKVSVKIFAFSKIIHTILSMIICYILTLIIGL